MAKTSFPNIDFRFRRGCLSALRNTAVLNGSINFTNDTRELYVDADDRRIKISDVIFSTEAEIVSLSDPENKLYTAVDTFKLLYFDFKSLKWKVVGSNDVSHSNDADFALCDGDGNIINKHYISIEDSNKKDSDLQDQIDDILHIIGNVERFDIEIINDIADLPIVGTRGIIYFVRENDDDIDGFTRTSKYYGEYIWIEDSKLINGSEISGYYEKIGITTVDLSNYYTRVEIDNMLIDLDNRTNRIINDVNNRITDSVSLINQQINQTNNSLDETKKYLELVIKSLEESLTEYIDNADYGDEG